MECCSSNHLFLSSYDKLKSLPFVGYPLNNSKRPRCHSPQWSSLTVSAAQTLHKVIRISLCRFTSRQAPRFIVVSASNTPSCFSLTCFYFMSGLYATFSQLFPALILTFSMILSPSEKCSRREPIPSLLWEEVQCRTLCLLPTRCTHNVSFFLRRSSSVGGALPDPLRKERAFPKRQDCLHSRPTGVSTPPSARSTG